DDALRLVADVDEHLVVVDADDMAGDDIPLLERMQGGVVVGDYLPIDLEQEAVGAFDDPRVRLIGDGQSCSCGHASPEDSRTGRTEPLPIIICPCLGEQPSAVRSARRCAATVTS